MGSLHTSVPLQTVRNARVVSDFILNTTVFRCSTFIRTIAVNLETLWRDNNGKCSFLYFLFFFNISAHVQLPIFFPQNGQFSQIPKNHTTKVDSFVNLSINRNSDFQLFVLLLFFFILISIFKSQMFGDHISYTEFIWKIPHYIIGTPKQSLKVQVACF